MPRTVKIAVVGSGLAGLTAAHLLERGSKSSVEFEVHLFEKAPSLGMDSSSISIPIPGQSREWRIDVPMRSFQGGYYPQLIQLYKRLGVAFRQTDFSYSFSLFTPSTGTSTRRVTTTMIYNGASGRKGLGMPSIMNEAYFQTKSESMTVRTVTKAIAHVMFILMTMQVLFNYLRLIFLSVPFLRPCRLENLTFREWTANTVPTLFSAVCTASDSDVMEHPMEEFLDYIWLTFGTHHYVAVNGIRDVVSRLSSRIRNIHLSSPISAIHAETSGSGLASIHCTTGEGTRVYMGFHHIIFGTQANHAVLLLASYLSSLPLESLQRQLVEDQIHCLQTFQYRPTIVINHMDGTLMPDAPEDRRDLNLICLDAEGYPGLQREKPISNCVPSSYTMATHILPAPAGYPPHLPTIYQTTNPILGPREDSIVSIARLERAVLTVEAKDALSGLYRETCRKWWQCAMQGTGTLGPLQGAGKLGHVANEIKGPGIWICGSFAYPGIPLLEGCVVSAQNVAEAIIALELQNVDEGQEHCE